MVNIRQLLLDILYRLGLIADYVIEEGVIDGWHYTKWNNGKAELWKITSSVTCKYIQTWNGLIHCTADISFPFAINNAICRCNLQVGSGLSFSEGIGAWDAPRSAIQISALGSQNTTSGRYSASLSFKETSR